MTSPTPPPGDPGGEPSAPPPSDAFSSPAGADLPSAFPPALPGSPTELPSAFRPAAPPAGPVEAQPFEAAPETAFDAAPVEQPPAAPPPPPTSAPPPLVMAPQPDERWAPAAPEPYPMVYEVAYRERLNRWTTLLRLPLLVPVMLFDFLVQYVFWAALFTGWTTVGLRKKYPAWLFSAAGGALAFQARYHAYGQLLTDRFPSFDREASPVVLTYDDPPNGRLSRWRVFFWKFFLLFPHFLVLQFLFLAVVVVTFFAWLAILFTGQYPRGMFGFVTGVNRWYFRVMGYFASFNDRFPPFSLSPAAGPGKGTAVVVCGVLGLFFGGGCIGLVTTGAILASQPNEASVDYAALQRGAPGAAYTQRYGIGETRPHVLILRAVTDPETELAASLETPANARVVVFEVQVERTGSGSDTIDRDFASLRYRDGNDSRSSSAALILVAGLPAPRNLTSRSTSMRVVFIVPVSATPTRLTLHPPWVSNRLEINFK